MQPVQHISIFKNKVQIVEQLVIYGNRLNYNIVA